MFKDELFHRAKRYVNPEITQEEAHLYVSGRIRKIYSSLEELLLDNISYYNRIIRSLLVFYENRVYEFGKYVGSLEKTKYTELMTPTRLYYLILVQPDFNRDEILLGHPQLKSTEGQTFRDLLPHLIKIGSFNFIASYTNTKFNTRSYTKGLSLDLTPNDFINKILDIKTVCYVDKKSLTEDFDKVQMIEGNVTSLEKMFYPYIKTKTFLSFTPSSLKISTADYSSSLSYSLNQINRSLTGSFKKAKRIEVLISSKIEDLSDIFKINHELVSDMTTLMSICGSMIQYFGKDFIAYRISSSGVYSTIVSKRFWNNRRLIETFYDKDNNPIHIQIKTFGKLVKAVDYIVNSGYFVYGDRTNKKLDLISITKTSNYTKLFDVYEKYGTTTLATSTTILALMSMQTEKIVRFMTGVDDVDTNELLS